MIPTVAASDMRYLELLAEASGHAPMIHELFPCIEPVQETLERVFCEADAEVVALAVQEDFEVNKR